MVFHIALSLTPALGGGWSPPLSMSSCIASSYVHGARSDNTPFDTWVVLKKSNVETLTSHLYLSAHSLPRDLYDINGASAGEILYPTFVSKSTVARFNGLGGCKTCCAALLLDNVVPSYQNDRLLSF